MSASRVVRSLLLRKSRILIEVGGVRRGENLGNQHPIFEK